MSDIRFKIPSTVSSEAAGLLGQVYALYAQRPKDAPLPATVDDWDQQNALVCALAQPHTDNILASLEVAVTDDEIGGTRVVRVAPSGDFSSDRTLVYMHGGAYVLFSARTSLVAPALAALANGCEVISIDYGLAPRSAWESTTGEVENVWRALLDGGATPRSVGFFGESAGAGLAAGSILRLRDQGLPLPGALHLISPWSDLNGADDTYETLAAADPMLEAPILAAAAAAYAPREEDLKHPYASPVYGDYSRAFPPTLIQGGTREIFLSHFVRLYQAIRGGGGEAVLDLYEGMPHSFQSLIPASPESRCAVARAAQFFSAHLAPR